MDTTTVGKVGTPAEERRRSSRLRTVYAEATEQLHHLFRGHDDWVGSTIDYVALRLVHERYRELTPNEVRALVTAIGGRQRYCISRNRLTALYP